MPAEFGSTSERNQARGLKDCINSNRASEISKRNAQQKLKEIQYRTEDDHDNNESPSSTLRVRIQDPPATIIPVPSGGQANALDEIEMAIQQGKNEENVVRGYKAVLKNPKVSDQAREHAEEMLESHSLW